MASTRLQANVLSEASRSEYTGIPACHSPHTLKEGLCRPLVQARRRHPWRVGSIIIRRFPTTDCPGPFGHRRPLSSARHQSLTSAYGPSRVSAGARGHTFDSPRSAGLTVGKSGSSRVPHVRACSSLFTGLHGSISQPDSGSVHPRRTCLPDNAGEWADFGVQ